MPAKPNLKKSDMKKIVGCTLTVGFSDHEPVKGILIMLGDGDYVLLSLDKRGRFYHTGFDSYKQVIKVDARTQTQIIKAIA
jgi:hypothetical protein